MNTGMVFYVIGHILKAEAVLMTLPWAVSLYYKESCATAFLITAACCAAAGFAIGFKKPSNTVIFAREGFVIVALSWIAMSLFGSLPFYISREIPSFVNSLFETVSGFTTTGASILTDIESMSRGLLFWRSFTHWIGGMGVLVFVMAVIPLSGGRTIHLMRAEVPGPTVGKLVPKVKNTALLLYGIYLFLTILLIVLLVLAGLPLFDSAVHAFGAAGTGGFSSKNASVGSYNNPAVDLIISVFMMIFGINFNLYFLLMLGNARSVLKNQELRAYLGIIAVSVLVVAVNIRPLYSDFAYTLRQAFFQVSSIMTTTGYSTTDFDRWPELSRSLLVGLMFLGASAGSTGGGIKIARVQILLASVRREIARMLHPRSIKVISIDGKPIEEETVGNAHVYLTTLAAIASLSVLLISVDGFNFETSFTAVAACLNNIGPGLGKVGAMGNYSAFSDFSKIVLSLNMLLGRLEVFPLIMLVSPAVWRRQ